MTAIANKPMKQASGKQAGRLTVGKVLIYALLAAGSLIMILPLYWMILSSMKGNTELFRMPPTFWPQKMMLAENYGKVLNASASFKFLQYYANSIGTGLLNTLFSVFTSALVGYVFAKYQFKFRNVLFMIMMACMMIPYETLMVSVYKIMIGFGWTNTYLVLTVPCCEHLQHLLMRQFMVDIRMITSTRRRSTAAGSCARSFIILPRAPALSSCASSCLWAMECYMWPISVTANRSRRWLRAVQRPRAAD